MDEVLLFFIIALFLLLDIKATQLILRDLSSKPKQRALQLALAWLLPALGAMIVFAVHRPTGKYSYKGKSDPGVDFGFSAHEEHGHFNGMDTD